MTGPARRLCCTCFQQYAPADAYKCDDCNVTATHITKRGRPKLEPFQGLPDDHFADDDAPLFNALNNDFLPAAEASVRLEAITWATRLTTRYNPEPTTKATKIN